MHTHQNCMPQCVQRLSTLVVNRDTTINLLRGANNITLEGVFHSISKEGTFADASQLVWYGSDEVIDAWLPSLL